MQVTWAPGYGDIDSEHAANRVRQQIQCEHKGGRALHEVLGEYIKDVPEDGVLHRYRAEFLPQRRVKHGEGRLSQKRLKEFEQYEQRGHLAYWAEVKLRKVSAAHLELWVHWLYQRGLTGGYIRHLVADFGTFLRYEKRIGSYGDVPELPSIDWHAEEKTVPQIEDARRIVDTIPEAQRGVWLARTLAGLRPAEGRRLDVRHYDFQAGELAIPTLSRHKRGRRLPIRMVVPELDEWIQKHRRGAMGAEPLFPRVRSRRWKAHAERLCWARACEAAGVAYVEPNAAGRHAFATHEVGVLGTDIYAAKEWMGHTSISTTEKYLHRRGSRLALMMRPVVALPKKADQG